MAESATIDEKGRVLLSKETRRKAKIKPRSRLLVRVRRPGLVELRDLEELSKTVQTVAKKKLHGWREEEHREDRMIAKLSEE